MKKSIMILFVCLITAVFSLNSFAATDAFKTIEVTPDTPYIDDDTTQDLGGSGQPIKWVEGYGCGYSSQNDIIYFEDIDFGANGAKSLTMKFGYGKEDAKTTLAVMIDDPKSAPVGTFEIGFTGGWEIEKAGDVTTDVKIPGGIHTVYIQFTNEHSGSISSIIFAQADAAAETTAAETTAVADTTAAAETAAPGTPETTTAAQTLDFGIFAGIAALASASLVIGSKKKK